MPLRTRPVTAACTAALAVAVTTGCLGDPAPDPATAPLEVVLDTCSLNRASVAAGTHDVAVVGQGTLTVRDPGGGVLLTARGGEAAPAEVALAAGRHVLQCEPDAGQAGQAEVHVEP